MTYGELEDLILQRCRRLKLLDPQTGAIDAADVESAMLDVELDLRGVLDLDAYTVTNERMVVTEEGRSDYLLPEDFGRLPPANRARQWGLTLWDGGTARPAPLEPWTLERWTREHSTTQQRPQQFVLLRERKLRLHPPPDSNNAAGYTVQGVYIQRVTRHDPEDEMSLTHPEALRDGTLARLATDYGHALRQELQTAFERSSARLFNAQERQHQAFQAAWSYRFRGRAR